MTRATKSKASTPCRQCGATMVTISLRVTQGERTMYSCSACDFRTWDAEGDPTELGDVLAELRETKVPRRNSRANRE